MVTRYFCDRCGKEEGLQAHLNWVDVRYHTKNSTGPHWDLCSQCTQDLEVFIEEGHPKQAGRD